MPNNVAGFRAKYKIPQRVLADLLKIKLPTYCNKENNVRAEFTRSEMVSITIFFKQYEPQITLDDLFFYPKVLHKEA